MSSQCRTFWGAVAVALLALADNAYPELGRKTGEEPNYWNRHTVVIARVVEINERRNYMTSTIKLRPAGVLSGAFDLGATEDLTAAVQMGDGSVGTAIRIVPKQGGIVLAVIRLPTADVPTFVVPPEFTTYMPERAAALSEIDNLTDSRIERVLDAIRDVRAKSEKLESGDLESLHASRTFWSAHALAFGKIAKRTADEEDPGIVHIDFRPMVTVSGRLDPGVVLKTVANVDLRRLAVPESFVAASGNALVLLVRDGDSYAVAPQCADFMPGDHFPICSVKDFADPKVAETLKKIQEARAKEKKPEKDAPKAEKPK